MQGILKNKQLKVILFSTFTAFTREDFPRVYSNLHPLDYIPYLHRLDTLLHNINADVKVPIPRVLWLEKTLWSSEDRLA